PVAGGLDPQRGTQVVCRFAVLIGGEATVPLEKTEPLAFLHPEKTELQFAAVVRNRTPDPFAAAHPDRQTVGVVHFGAEIVEATSRILAEPEHARHRGEAESFDRFA